MDLMSKSFLCGLVTKARSLMDRLEPF
jgi:hypothetical protein